MTWEKPAVQSASLSLQQIHGVWELHEGGTGPGSEQLFDFPDYIEDLLRWPTKHTWFEFLQLE